MAVTTATVETTIEAVQSQGQAIASDGLSQTQAPIDGLARLRERLQNETLRSGGTRPLFRAVNLSAAGYD